MFMSLCDELAILLFQEIRLQFDKDSHKSTFRHEYILSFFFPIETKETF